MDPQLTLAYVDRRKRALHSLSETVEEHHQRWLGTCMGVFISQEDIDRALAHDEMIIKEHRAHRRMFARHMRRLDKLEGNLISSQ